MNLKILLPAIFVFLCSTQVEAQFGGGPPGGARGGGKPPLGARGERAPAPVSAMSRAGPSLVDQMWQQFVEVGEKLMLRTEQEPEWESYKEKVGMLIADQMRARPPTSEPMGSAMQQIDVKVDVVRNRLAAMEDIADAARKLYSKLDATQKAVADQLLQGTLPALYSGLASGCGPRDENNGGRRDGPPGRPGRGD